MAVAVFGIALFAFVSRHWAGTGVAGGWIRDLVGWLFGEAADPALALVAFYSLCILVGRRPPRAKRFGMVVALLVLLGALQLRAASAAFPDLRASFVEFLALGAEAKGGGVLGAVFSFVFVRFLDRIGTQIALGLGGLVAALLVLDARARRWLATAFAMAGGVILAVSTFLFKTVVGTVAFIAQGFVGLVRGFVQPDDLREERRAPKAGEAEQPRRNGKLERGKEVVTAPGDRDEARPGKEPERTGLMAWTAELDRLPQNATAAEPAVATSQSFPAASGSAQEPIRIRQYEPQPQPEERSTALHGTELATQDAVAVYSLPALSLLGDQPIQVKPKAVRNLADQARLLEETLANFGIQAKVVQVDQGPVVTRYELQPAPGVKVSRIVSLADDISLSLAAADVRIEAPIPGKAAVGIEVPNKEVSVVHMREVLASAEFQKPKTKLALALGKDIAGSSVVCDLTDMPHLLIAGATGSGKSVCMNTMITSLLYRQTPDTCKILMVDPKRVELANYDGIPHLLAPVVTDPKKAAGALKWVVEEMEKRYELFAAGGVRNIEKYNETVAAEAQPGEPDQRLPFIVVFIDELADLMIVAAADVEDAICRLAQMARAAGIHLVIATQRPSVDVITGLIKANIPSRVAFAVSSQVDSRTILDMAGAERLLGRGDMLFCPVGAVKPVRVQGAYISDREVEALAEFWKRQGRPDYKAQLVPTESKVETDTGDDELFDDAVKLVLSTGSASISMVQRRFRIGYARAARLIDMMELAGIVGPYQGSKPREILVDRNPRE